MTHPLTAPRFFLTPKKTLILLLVFGALLFSLLPASRHTAFYYDDYNHFERVQKIFSSPSAVWSTDNKDHRRSPLSVLVLFLGHLCFGLNPQGYFAFLFFSHFLNALLLGRLALRLRNSPEAALTASLLFLCSGAFYQILIAIPGITRTLSLFFFLLATLAWLDYLDRPRWQPAVKTVLWALLALCSSPVAMIFPLSAAYWIPLQIQDKKKRFQACLLGVFPLSLVFFAGVFWTWGSVFSSGASGRWIASYSPGFLTLKGLSALRMLFAPLVIPEKGLLGISPLNHAALRLLPLFIISGGLAVLARQRGWNNLGAAFFNPMAGIAAGWILITLLLHMPFPLMFEHATRYLYFPMAGFCLWFGAFALRVDGLAQLSFGRTGRYLCLSILIYILGINIAATRHYMQVYHLYARTHPAEVYTEKIHALFSQDPPVNRRGRN